MKSFLKVPNRGPSVRKMTSSPPAGKSVKGVKSVRIQASAIFSIFDQFQRRSELCTGRLIGAIFGVREEDSDGVITVSQAFPIPHSEINDQVSVWEGLLSILFTNILG